MAKFRNRIKSKIRIAGAISQVGSSLEKQRAYIDKELDTLTADQLFKVAMKSNALLKAAHKDPCHINQHDDCIDETCKCDCHKTQHFVPFDPKGRWAWAEN